MPGLGGLSFPRGQRGVGRVRSAAFPFGHVVLKKGFHSFFRKGGGEKTVGTRYSSLSVSVLVTHPVSAEPTGTCPAGGHRSRPHPGPVLRSGRRRHPGVGAFFCCFHPAVAAQTVGSCPQTSAGDRCCEWQQASRAERHREACPPSRLRGCTSLRHPAGRPERWARPPVCAEVVTAPLALSAGAFRG